MFGCLSLGVFGVICWSGVLGVCCVVWVGTAVCGFDIVVLFWIVCLNFGYYSVAWGGVGWVFVGF